MAGKEVTVKAAQDQWQWVMFYLNNFMMPDKLGTREYTQNERGRIQREISALFDTLAAVSHYAMQHGDDYAALFGAEDDWAKERDALRDRKSLCPSKMYEIRLSADAESGLLWMFTVLLTPPTRIHNPQTGAFEPSHPYFVLPSLASRFIWPIVAQLGRTVYLKRALGWDDAPLCTWSDDTESLVTPIPVKAVKADEKGGAK